MEWMNVLEMIFSIIAVGLPVLIMVVRYINRKERETQAVKDEVLAVKDDVKEIKENMTEFETELKTLKKEQNIINMGISSSLEDIKINIAVINNTLNQLMSITQKNEHKTEALEKGLASHDACLFYKKSPREIKELLNIDQK